METNNTTKEYCAFCKKELRKRDDGTYIRYTFKGYIQELENDVCCSVHCGDAIYDLFIAKRRRANNV